MSHEINIMGLQELLAPGVTLADTHFPVVDMTEGVLADQTKRMSFAELQTAIGMTGLTPGFIPVALTDSSIGDSILEQNSGSIIMQKTGTTPNAFVAGYLLDNITTASAGNQMYSPSIIMSGRGWKTTATAASQSVAFKTEVIPVEGTTAPTGRLAISSSIAGGAYAERLSVLSGGNVGINTTSPNTLFEVKSLVDDVSQIRISHSAQPANYYMGISNSTIQMHRTSSAADMNFTVTGTYNAGFGSIVLNPIAGSAVKVTQAPGATANYGLVSLASGPYDGSTTGFFVGSASGTVLAINTASGYAGNLVDYQVAGVRKLSVSYGTFVPGAVSTTYNGFVLANTYASTAAASGAYHLVDLSYTINNTGTANVATATGIFLNATETALNGMGHNLMDLRVGSASKFRVARDGSSNWANNVWLSATNFAGASTVNMFKVNASDEIDVGALMNISGGLEGPLNGGALVLYDMPVTAAAGAGVEESVTMRLGTTNILKLYSESNGAGAIQQTKIVSYCERMELKPVTSTVAEAMTTVAKGTVVSIGTTGGSIFTVEGLWYCTVAGATGSAAIWVQL